jgi:hypothetical protein
MNLSGLRIHTRNLIGIQSIDLLSDADLNTFINEAYLDICRTMDWTFLRNETTFNTVSGQGVYSLPAGIAETRIASVAALNSGIERRALKPRSRISTDDSYVTITNGEPIEYSVWRGTLEVYPIPTVSEIITIRYFDLPQALVTNTDIPVFDEPFHTIISYGAAVRALMREGDDTKRPNFYAELYRAGVEQMREEYLTERDRSVFRLGGRRKVRRSRSRYYGA